MKTNKSKFFKMIYPAVLLVGLGVASCKEDDENLEPMRMFIPGGEISSNAGETEVTLTWKTPPNTVAGTSTYTVEVAKDTLFQTPVILTAQADTAKITFTNQQLNIKENYFARVKTNAKGNSPESKWLVSSRFSIRGEQIFNTPLSSEIKDKTVLLNWRPSAGLTRIVITPANGTARTINLTPADLAANQLLVTNLTATTSYTAEIFAGTLSKGTITFTTKEPSLFTYTVSPSDDLVAIVASAANGDVIGLEPGVYTANASNILIAGKMVTLQSTSGNPANTKVHFKEITLKGTGAGVKVSGIEFDGKNAAGTTVGDYFINIDAEAGTLSSITVENSNIHDIINTFLRANRGAAGGSQKINFIKVDNSIVSRNAVSSYQTFMLDRLDFNRLDVTNSTFNEAGRGLISWATNYTPAVKPTILINKVTLNSFGSGGRDNIILDANALPVIFTVQNSIIANSPKAGQTVLASALRAGTGSEVQFMNNNFFKLEGGSPLAPLTFPAYVQLANNKTIDLGWTHATTDFSLPAGSELRTAGVGGTSIGDPRWVK
ncbi:DUF4957 domain-containing protein [Rufibacter glacialis]|uniref:DUF4957 domain-containing protein n=1 Tax=Rufibacter glacialis TaxID=1259555 RepID=A0A5M8Q5P4_9BACT|nr:DUF4957 domain-containing protein [Rufibacter glacialis]KAA6430663.1 DUF4957 domain-containing protein [Rufibacter glacialis]GGK85574.1 hypothetical protein GCM10011405_36800 [Rufibacter glacialis]